VDSILTPQPYPDEARIKAKGKVAAYTGAGWPHSCAYPALFAAAGLFFGCEGRLNERGEQVNDDAMYHVQAALTGEAFAVQYSELFEPNVLQRCLSIYSTAARVVGCENLSEEQTRAAVCAAVAGGAPVVVEPKAYADILFVFGYRESGAVLLCCPFLDGADEKNRSYDFAKPRALRNRTAGVRRLIVLESADLRADAGPVYHRALRSGLRMMAAPSDAMDFRSLRGAGGGLYEAWIALLREANAVNSGFFYMDFPVFPQVIILYENRLHLKEFLNAYADVNGESETLTQAIAKADELVNLAMEAMLIGTKCAHTKPEILEMNENEKRTLLTDILRRCNAAEREMAGLLDEACGERE